MLLQHLYVLQRVVSKDASLEPHHRGGRLKAIVPYKSVSRRSSSRWIHLSGLRSLPSSSSTWFSCHQPRCTLESFVRTELLQCSQGCEASTRIKLCECLLCCGLVSEGDCAENQHNELSICEANGGKAILQVVLVICLLQCPTSSDE